MSHSPLRVLVIGATGLIGRPVTRHLVHAGMNVRALVRDEPAAAAALPESCTRIVGDLRDPASLDAAMADVDILYLSTSNPMTAEAPDWDPDGDGVQSAIDAAQRAGVRRVMRLSALAIDQAADDWWVARTKTDTDAYLMASGVPYTIFRPTWFMESIALSSLGPILFDLPGDTRPIYWIAAADYARQVAAAMQSESARDCVIRVQGPEGVSMSEAFRRFASVWKQYLIRLPLPRAAITLGARVSAPMSYLDALLEYTYEHVTREPAIVEGHDFAPPVTTIESFAKLLLATGEFPTKR